MLMLQIHFIHFDDSSSALAEHLMFLNAVMGLRASLLNIFVVVRYDANFLSVCTLFLLIL